jgi:hypothetical protein
MTNRLTPNEVIENNKRIIKENNLKNLNDINAYILKIRLENRGDK